MKYIILDLEATCWEDRPKDKQNEIIEIGAVAVNENGEIMDEFAEFIQPKLNPILSDFCKTLTTITQAEIDAASSFPAVIQSFWKWIGIHENDYLLCSWGFYDKKQFQKDCELHGLDTNWLDPHISVKHQYQKIKGLKRPIGMGHALKNESLILDGTHHRGIDDARNIAKIFLRYLGEWVI